VKTQDVTRIFAPAVDSDQARPADGASPLSRRITGSRSSVHVQVTHAGAAHPARQRHNVRRAAASVDPCVTEPYRVPAVGARRRIRIAHIGDAQGDRDDHERREQRHDDPDRDDGQAAPRSPPPYAGDLRGHRRTATREGAAADDELEPAR
jgi:hypothetical protein